MSKYLVIVESPNKIKHIKHFLTTEYKVMASIGHVRRINDSGKYKMGIDYDNDFKTDYIVDEKKRDVVKELRAAVKTAEIIYLASDDDAEGEAIAWHLADLLKIPEKKLKRAIFKEITKKAVLDGIANAGKINQNKASAALTRAKLDKLMGYRLSPIVIRKTGGNSAGRVQSVALKIISEREKEIKNFKPKTYYEIYMSIIKDRKEYKVPYVGKLKKYNKKVKQIEKTEEAQEVLLQCKNQKAVIQNIEHSISESKAKPPFITSSLQQECSNRFSMPPKKTMEIAQRLFEKGFITYMRTDSTRLSDEFVVDAKDFIIKFFGEHFIQTEPKKEKKEKGNVQDAHEAIRPTSIANDPNSLEENADLTLQEINVYNLIYRRAVSSLMKNAEYNVQDIIFNNADNIFLLRGKVMNFPGYMALYIPEDKEDDEVISSPFKLNEEFDNTLEMFTKQTKAPSRYSEASLIKKLEDLKIGRPSTYAHIVSVITDEKRDYAKVENKTIVPTDKGLLVDSFIGDNFKELINYTYTAEMEALLDKISAGETTDLEVLSSFYKELSEMLNDAKDFHVEREKPTETDKKCPTCGKILYLRKGKNGDFYACSGFPKCRFTESLTPYVPKEKPPIVGPIINCDKCKTGVFIKRTSTKGKNEGKSFYACNGFPKCKNIINEEEFNKRLAESTINPLSIDKDENGEI